MCLDNNIIIRLVFAYKINKKQISMNEMLDFSKHIHVTKIKNLKFFGKDFVK